MVLIQSPWSLFRFHPLYLLTKGLWGVQISVGGVHFRQRGVHLLIISQERKIRSQSPFTKRVYDLATLCVYYAPTLISVPFWKMNVI